jgi:hypothetical protein
MKTRQLKLCLLPAVALMFAAHCGKFSIVNIEPKITVIFPTAGNTLETGSTYTVRWTMTDRSGDTVTIALANGSGAPVVIDTLPADLGACPWTIPLSSATGSSWQVIVRSTTAHSLYGSSGFFTIANYLDQYEPDSTAALAKNIETDGTIQYRTMPGSDRDWCSFTATAGLNYCIRTYGAFDTYLELFAPNGTTLLSHDDDQGTGLNALIIWECTAGGTYYVRVMAKTTGKPQAYSINVRANVAILEIVYPDSGRRFTGGDIVPLEWKHSGNAGTAVSLFLYRGDSLVSTVAQGTFDDGDYVWTIPYACPTSPDYRIGIVSDADASIGDTSGPFTITCNPVSFTISAPTSGAQWNTGSAYFIRWTTAGNPGTGARLSLYENGVFVSGIVDSTAIAAGYYRWFLPAALPTSAAYQIKITALTDSSVFDESDLFTIMKTPATITVTLPSSGTNWNTGTSHTIYWSFTGNPGTYVNVTLFDGSALVAGLSPGVGTATAAGSFLWNIPWTLPTSSNYRIQITSISDTTVYGWSSPFTLTHVSPTITVTAPAAGAVWSAGTSYSINWTTSATVPGDYVAIYLCDSAQTIMAIDSGYLKTVGSYLWTIPVTLAGGTSYRVKVVSTGDTSVYGCSGTFTVITRPNRVTLTAPTSGSSWIAGDWYTIYWTYTGAGLVGTDITLELYDSASLIDTLLPSAAIANLSYPWQIPLSLPAGSGYRVKISSVALDTVHDFSDYFIVTNPALIGDKYEPDSTFAQAKAIVKDSAAQSRTLSDTLDEDWIKFAAVSGTTYTIETQGPTDTYINLYGTDGVSLLASDDDSGTYPNAKIVWTCPSSGTYYFTVAGWSVGSYTVTLR